MYSIFNLTQEELQDNLELNNYPKYRGKQIYEWIYKKKTYNINLMNNLPKELKYWLKIHYSFDLPVVRKKQVSQKDGTTKFLLEYNDKSLIEAVLMYHKEHAGKIRKTLCISSQVGCAIGCVFCATGKNGYTRNLTTGEIIGQILSIINIDGDIDNIVFMGMGEPLLNYDNVVKSIRIITDERGLNFSIRKITISTCGMVPQIKRLAEEGIPLTLAISLHAANDTLRSKLIPINKKYNIEELINAVKLYIKHTNRKVTFEYILIKDINDSIDDAIALATILKPLLCNVNLIPANPVADASMKKPSQNVIKSFQQKLQSLGIEAVIRKEKGADIDAACGQLKARETN